MTLIRSPFLWALAMICIASLLLGGCGEKKPATDPGVAATDESAKQDEKTPPEDEAKPDEPPQQDAKTVVDDAGKAAAGEDTEAALKAVESLGAFLTSDDADLIEDASKILVDVAQEGDEPRVRAAAVRALAEKADLFIDLFAKLAQNPEPVLRDAAILSLGLASKGSAAEPILKQLAQSSDPAVKRLAGQALAGLGKGGERNETAMLVAELGNPVNDASAQAAIKLKLMGADALPELEKAIRFSPNPRQRHAATMCVASICAGTSPTQKRFSESVKSVKKGENRGDPANLDGLPILLHAVRDPDPMTREMAAQGLGYLGSEKAATPLAQALKDEDVHVRRRAASALVMVPAGTVLDDVVQAALHDDDETVRRFAAEALGWIGGAKAAKALIAASKDTSPEVRRYAAMQLGRTKEEGTLQALIDLYTSARKRELELKTLDERTLEQDVRWAAVQAVAELRDRSAKDVLLTALDDPVPQVANAAETGLQKLGISKRRMPGVD